MSLLVMIFCVLPFFSLLLIMSLLVMVFYVHVFACGTFHNGVLSPLLVFLFIGLLPIMFYLSHLCFWLWLFVNVFSPSIVHGVACDGVFLL